MSSRQSRRDRRAANRALVNRANAQFSTGPKTEEGRAIVSQNNLRHGLSGTFQVLACESQEAFDALFQKLAAEHRPANPLEEQLVQNMAQHFWLAQRAIGLQEKCFNELGEVAPEKEKQLALYLRYQTTHERAFHKYTAELRSLRNGKRKAEIGFESQKRYEAQEARRETAEERRRDLHKWAVLQAQAAYEHQEFKNLHLETPECRIPNRVQRILAAEAA